MSSGSDPKCTKTAGDVEYIRKNAREDIVPGPLECDTMKEIVIECFKKHKLQTIKCQKEVELFETCVKGQVVGFLMKNDQRSDSKIKK